MRLGVLHPALGPSAQQRCGPVGTGQGKGHKYDHRDEAPVLERQAERAWTVQCEEEKALGRHHCSLPVHKEGLLKGGRGTYHMGRG